jgi:Ca2+-binding EF-hand superfamily protein
LANEAPNKHFEIAFQMFDVDGNGDIDYQEFEQLHAIIRNQTSLGQRHRDTHMTGSVIKENSNLNEYFFGKNKDQLLTVKKFSEFHRQLQFEVLKIEVDFNTNTHSSSIYSF